MVAVLQFPQLGKPLTGMAISEWLIEADRRCARAIRKCFPGQEPGLVIVRRHTALYQRSAARFQLRRVVKASGSIGGL